MERKISGISKFPEKRTTSRGWPKFSKWVSGNFLFHLIWTGIFGNFGRMERAPFFWKFGNSGNFLFHLAFLPGMNRPQFLWLWKATRWRRVFGVDTSLDAKWSAIARACPWSLHENVKIWFPGKLWTGRSEFPVGQFARFAYYTARKVRKFNSLTNIKEERVKFLHMKPLHHDLSAFCRVILGGKCAQARKEWDRSGLAENTVPFDIRKFRKFKPEFLVEWNAPLDFDPTYIQR